MLDALRRGAAGWLAKLLFAILVLSFAIWGIPHEFLGGGGNYLARVGSTAISANEFQRAFNQDLRTRQMQGERITTEEARAAGLDGFVLKGLVDRTALQETTQDLKLALPDHAIADTIRDAKAFAGTDGKFSRPRFEEYLERANLSEAGFIRLLRDDELNTQLTGALSAAVVAPAPIVDLQNAYLEETRVIEHVTVDPKKLPPPAEPDEAKLKETFEQNKAAFATPEIRKIGALILSPDELKKGISIPDEDVQAAYEATRHDYEEPERRQIEQISFSDKAAAEAGKKEIAGGKGFVEVASAAGRTEADIKLGLKAKSELIEDKVAEAAFALSKDQVSEVIESSFGPVLVRVTEIVPGKQSTFDEVKDKVRDKLSAEKASTLIQEKSDEVQDGLNAGKTLKEIADQLKLTYIEAETDKDNKTADGREALAHPDAATIVQAGFALQQGTEPAAVDLPASHGSAWPNLLGVTPSQPKSFEAVKDAVKALYLKTEAERALAKFANELVARLTKGEALSAVATDAGGTPETTLPVTRNTSPQGLPRSGVARAFALPVGQAGSTETSDGTSAVVFRVKEVKPAPQATKEQTDKLTGALTTSLQQDLVETYLSVLRQSLDVQINEKEFRRVTGADDEQP